MVVKNTQAIRYENKIRWISCFPRNNIATPAAAATMPMITSMPDDSRNLMRSSGAGSEWCACAATLLALQTFSLNHFSLGFDEGSLLGCVTGAALILPRSFSGTIATVPFWLNCRLRTYDTIAQRSATGICGP